MTAAAAIASTEPDEPACFVNPDTLQLSFQP
jgi:hypothetical protein